MLFSVDNYELHLRSVVNVQLEDIDFFHDLHLKLCSREGDGGRTS